MAGKSSYDEDDMTTLSDINVVPLVDVVLVLLIVFMITVPAVVGSAAIKVDLPETSSVKVLEIEDLPIHLYLQKTDSGSTQLYLNDKPIDEAGLSRQLSNDYVKSKERPTTYLAADKNIPYGEVTRVFDMLNKLGLNKISLDTKHVAR